MGKIKNLIVWYEDTIEDVEEIAGDNIFHSERYKALQSLMHYDERAKKEAEKFFVSEDFRDDGDYQSI